MIIETMTHSLTTVTAIRLFALFAFLKLKIRPPPSETFSQANLKNAIFNLSIVMALC